MKNLLILILCLATTSILANSTGMGKINGTIKDASKQAIPFATLSLNDAEGKLITGTISDEDGSFYFEGLEFQTYQIKAQYLGYNDFEEEIILSKKIKKAEILIEMTEDIEVLEEVVVTQEKSTVSLRLGKKEFLVGKDILSQGGDALEVLNQVPSVSVDPNGTVLLRGSSAVQILINGKRSALTMNNGIDQISAENIEKVEVITNPSSRYDAQGSAGIINIVLKKNKLKGWNGQLRLKSGTPADYSIMPGINYKSSKFNAFANLRWRYSDYKGLHDTNQETELANGSTQLLSQNEKENRHDDGRSAYAGADLYLNEKSSLTMAYYRSETRDSDETTLNYNIEESTGNTNLLRIGNSLENRNYNQIELSYSNDLKKEGQSLSIEFQNDFWNSTKDWDLNSTGDYESPNVARRLRTKNESSSNDYVLKSDYNQTIGKEGNVEVGIKLENRQVESIYSAESLNENEWETFAGINNTLDYTEMIGAAYVQYSGKFKKIEYSFGLRSEYTDLKIEDRESLFSDTRTYNNIFPSVQLSSELSEKHSVQLSYSRRINRPSLWSLYPFSDITDFNQQDIGNPNLRAAYADAVELGFLNIFDKITINSSLYFKDIKDPTAYIVDYTDAEVFVFQPINIEKRREAGFETSMRYRPLEWMSLRGEFNVFQFNQNGQYLDRDLSAQGLNYNFRISAEFDLKHDISFSSRLQYRGKEVSALYEVSSSSILSFGVNKSFLKDKISFGINAFNVLDTRIQKTTTLDPSFDFEHSARRYGPRYSLNFVYKFNQSPRDRMRRANRANRN